MTTEKRSYWLINFTAVYQEGDKTKQAVLSSVLCTKQKFINEPVLNKFVYGTQARLQEQSPDTQLLSFMINSVSSLGEMTDEEYSTDYDLEGTENETNQ